MAVAKPRKRPPTKAEQAAARQRARDRAAELDTTYVPMRNGKAGDKP